MSIVKSKNKTPEFTASQVAKIQKAVSRLLLDHTYIGAIAVRMPIKPYPQQPGKTCIACVTLSAIHIAQHVVDEVDIPTLMWLIGHEVYHLQFLSFEREKDKHHVAWNIATDFANNLMLEEDGVGTMYPGALYDKKYEGMTAEEIYDSLEEEDVCLDEFTSQQHDEHLDEDEIKELDEDGNPVAYESEAEKSDAKQNMRQMFYDAAKTATHVPGNMAKILAEYVKPKIIWQDLLTANLRSAVANNYTSNIQAKKYRSSGIWVPEMQRQSKLSLCVARDVSGSVSAEELNYFSSEIKSIMESFSDYEITLIDFDTSVIKAETYVCEMPTNINEVSGGGGTNFECVWDYLKENSITPEQIVLFTDGYPCGSWGDPSYSDTIFVVTSDVTAPWGITAPLKIT